MAKEKDNNKRGIMRFINLFDIVIILIAVVMVIILAALGFVGADTFEVRYTIELSDMVGETASLIKEGDLLVDQIKKLDMGTVESVEVKQSDALIRDMTGGAYVLVENPDRQTAVVTVKAQATLDGADITTTSGYIVKVGTSVSLTGPGYRAYGNVIEMDRIPEEDGNEE